MFVGIDVFDEILGIPEVLRLGTDLNRGNFGGFARPLPLNLGTARGGHLLFGGIHGHFVSS
jgi:hypothetical protein